MRFLRSVPGFRKGDPHEIAEITAKNHEMRRRNVRSTFVDGIREAAIDYREFADITYIFQERTVLMHVGPTAIQ